MEYQDALDFLYEQLPMYQRIGKAAMKADLSNTIALSNVLNAPHEAYQSIHIAGTNGKGATSHMLASVLQESGYKVGLYTSPHLKSFRERIRINGKMIDESYVVSFVEQMKDAVTTINPSFFEVTVVMALDYFRAQQVDFAVIETGLGGRLDSTNIIDPVMSVITSISLDHEDLLGKGIRNIAVEKGGIIKKGKPVVVGKLSEEAVEALENISEQKSAPFLDNAKDYEKVESNEITSFVFNHEVTALQSELTGDSLIFNVPTLLESVKCLQNQSVSIDKQSVVNGINHVVTNTGLKGRWQVLNKSPFTICDIGHNIEAVSSLMNRLRKTTDNTKKLHVVWGMAADKSIDEILSVLILGANYYFCAADTPRSLDKDTLMKQAVIKGLRGDSYDSVDQAYQSAKERAAKDDVIFIGGSTFVVAELKEI